MSEHQSSEFDERPAMPSRPADSESDAPPAPSIPLRPHAGDVPAPPPPFGGAPEEQTEPPAGPEPGAPERAVPAPPVSPEPFRPAFDSEKTSIVRPEWVAQAMGQRGGEPAPDDGKTHPYSQAGPPPPGQLTTPLPPPPVFGAPGSAPSRPGQAGQGFAAGRAGEQGRGGWQGQPPQGWQGQPRPTLGREGASAPAAPAASDWSAAQGSAASWNYVDNIRSSELVPTRRLPPQRGWRKVLYYSTFKLINPGQSPDERYEAELQAKVRTLLRGTYKIGVLGKGGVGKSTTAAGVGSIFAELRQDDRVVAVDADTAFGKLGARIDPKASNSFWEVAADRNLHSFADMRARVGSNAAGLFVLTGPSETARRRVLDPAIYREAIAQLDRHFTLSIVDCGSTMDSEVTRTVLDDVDALIVVSSPWFDGASAAGQTLEWLANGGYTALLHRTVVVINDSDGHASKKDLKLLTERFGKHGQKVITLPYDQHLRPGGVIDVQNEVDPLTRRRYLELAAACAEHFAATTDRPRSAVGPGQPPAAGPVDRRGV